MDQSEYQRQYYQKNKKRILAKQKERRKDPKFVKRVKDTSKKHYEKNKDSISKRHKKYALKNRNATNAWARKYRKKPAGRYAHHKKKAKQRGIIFDIDKKIFIEWLDSQSGKCDYCGVELNYDVKYDAPSIDRKDNNQGYMIENITNCCRLCNCIKLDYFTYDEMKELGKKIKQIRGKRKC